MGERGGGGGVGDDEGNIQHTTSARICAFQTFVGTGGNTRNTQKKAHALSPSFVVVGTPCQEEYHPELPEIYGAGTEKSPLPPSHHPPPNFALA